MRLIVKMTDDERREHLNFLVRLNHPDVLDAMIRLKDMRSKMKRADNTYEMQFSDRVEYSKYVDVVKRYLGKLNEPFHEYFKIESAKTDPWFEGLIAIHSPIDFIREAAKVIVKGIVMKLKLTITTQLNNTTSNEEAWKLTDEIAHELRHLSILGKHLIFSRDGVHDYGFGNKEHFIVFESKDDKDDE